jgi:hypothetical protein
MIAEALKGALGPKYANVQVDLYSAAFTDKERNLRFSYEMPRTPQLALIDFDRGKVPEPFSFELRRARKITRRRQVRHPVKAGEPRTRARPARDGKPAVSDTDYNRYGDGVRSGLHNNDAAIVDALNDPSAPLFGPTALNSRGASSGRETIIGGASTPMSNFAKSRRFGLRQLIEWQRTGGRKPAFLVEVD